MVHNFFIIFWAATIFLVQSSLISTVRSTDSPISEVTEMVKSAATGDEVGIYNSQNSVDSVGTKKGENVKELDTWEAPYDMRKAYVYYHAGFDDENRPVWAAEIGKWNFRLVTDGRPEVEEIFNKYLQQLAHRIIKSIQERSTDEEPVEGAVLILDMEGFDLVKMSHLPTVSLALRMLVQFRHILDQYLHIAMFVNTSAAAQGLFSLARPILGPIFQRTEILGTNRAKWVPQLLKVVPKNTLPAWYGGNADFTPLKIYG